MSFVLFSNIFFSVFWAYHFNRFFLNFNFDFGVLAQKCPNRYVKDVFKFLFLFLNLSSKVLAGVIVRTSKYPYMDICALATQCLLKRLVKFWEHQKKFWDTNFFL